MIMTNTAGQTLITNYLQAAALRPEEPDVGTTDTHSTSSHKAQAIIVSTIQQKFIKRRRIVIDDDDYPESASTVDAEGKAIDGLAVQNTNAEVQIKHETPAQAAIGNYNRLRTQQSEPKQKHRHGKHHRDRTGKRRSRHRSPSPPPSSVSHQKIISQNSTILACYIPHPISA
jgi:hypothetical protein